MKRLSLLFGFILCLTAVQAQRFVLYSADSSRIKYATFQEEETRGVTSEDFLATFLRLDPLNRFIPSDTTYSPDSAYCHIKYRQYYNEYYVENSMVILTYHYNSIIRFKGYYLPIRTILSQTDYTVEDAINRYKQHYRSNNDSCFFYVETLITEDSSISPKLAFKIQSGDLYLNDRILYVSTSDLSVLKEENTPSSNFNFNATLPTRYNGIRYGHQSGWYPLYELSDYDAAVRIMKIDSNVTVLGTGVPNTFYNSTNVWDNYSDTTYPQHILDAYWAACQYSYYMQNTFNCPKDYFQRTWNPNIHQYIVDDTITWVYVALNTFVDNTMWLRQSYEPQFKDNNPNQLKRNIIIVGAQGLNHYPKASIDEVVHEYAHIFSYQSWSPFQNPYYIDLEVNEACSDIWAAIITNSIYHDEEKTWKIGEDVVLPTSGHTCVRNLANPSDPSAEIQMNDNLCQQQGVSDYERSGIFSHWFYLLTHGYSGEGCTGICYNFDGIPIDSAAKLMYYLECEELINHIDSYEDLSLFTLDATVNFSNPEVIRTSVLGAWNVVGVKPFSTGIEQFGLSYSSQNVGTYFVEKDLVIDSSRTLTVKGTIHLSDTCSIIILPGSKLVVDGGTLTSACPGELWQGIEVVGDRTKRQIPQWQGTVELKNGAVIENARCGIRTGLGEDNWHTTGGIIKADSSFFINNRRAVAFLSYTNHSPAGTITDNQSSFSRCVFTVDNNNLFSQNNTAFLDHVTMWEVRGVKFLGCTFSNQTSERHQRRHAIYADDAGFKIDTYCKSPTNIFPDC
ncbi:MAG: peptidase M4 family protein, partial [Bacteroidales bacterium]|nr:peptidase M4 family protein [Bacteroidales bacterium]